VAHPSIAFLGIGLMGRPMATRLLEAGFPLTAWNRTRAKAEALPGAVVATSPAAAVAQADIVITMLEAGPIVIDVIEQILPALRTGFGRGGRRPGRHAGHHGRWISERFRACCRGI